MSDELLTSHRILSSIIGSDPTIQREHVFYTKCAVYSKVCSVIIDGDSCTNIASRYMVEKLGLVTTPHPHPYQIRGLSDKEELQVEDQVRVPFRIGRYMDTVTCDVIPMQASHMLLGRPWQMDREAVRDGQTNRYTIRHEGRRFILAPMSPEQVREMIRTSPQTRNSAKLSDSLQKDEQIVRKEEPVLLLVPKEEEGKIQSEENLPIKSQKVLKECQSVLTDEIPSGLPLIQGIKINFVPEDNSNRTWPFDREAVPDCRTNQYSIKNEERPFRITPLTPKPIREPTPTILLQGIIFHGSTRFFWKFIKDRGREHLIHNPRRWFWVQFHPGEKSFFLRVRE